LFDDRFVFRSGVISDELWAVVEPVLPSGVGRRGRPWNDHRRTLEGIAWRFRTGAPWRDLPEEFGGWQSVWERHRRWSEDGTYQRMFAAVGEHHALGDARAAGLLSIDSTSIGAPVARAPTSARTIIALTGSALSTHGSRGI
jgi:transposase